MRYLILMLLFFVVGCNTFKPVKIKGEIQECNDMYTIMRFYSNLKVPDTIIARAYDKCTKMRQVMRERNCKKWIFGKKSIDKNNHTLYLYYKNCSQ